MTFLTLGLAGVVIGAVGSELLRAIKPEFVEEIEESAKRFVGRIGIGSKGGEDEPTDE